MNDATFGFLLFIVVSFACVSIYYDHYFSNDVDEE